MNVHHAQSLILVCPIVYGVCSKLHIYRKFNHHNFMCPIRQWKLTLHFQSSESERKRKNEIYSSSHLPGYESITLFDASSYTTSQPPHAERATKYICRKLYACSRPHHRVEAWKFQSWDLGCFCENLKYLFNNFSFRQIYFLIHPNIKWDSQPWPQVVERRARVELNK